ncbi:hypothetical protein [Leptolyngbya sp. FACHB-16]|uniref:hypothetical protein n=1 Tax=unclassified Leptolyngbya TaxID=2650499 RepID=UPI00168540C7|nr:hypothetical protein [Leptolyngbya sp. FACHB-16]MBD2154518.1 hypothetical protein [Leptolyngbya sp. FACHB-16]
MAQYWVDVMESIGLGGNAQCVRFHPNQGQPVMLTEFGGIACTRSDDTAAERA